MTPPSLGKISLRMAVGSLVTLLLVCLGLILTLYSFEGQKQLALQNTNQIFRQTALITDEKLASMLIPVRNFVEITAKLPGLSQANLDQYRKYLPYMAQIISKGQGIASVYVGYENGSFYMLSQLSPAAQATAPENSFFYLKEITLNKGQLQLSQTFFTTEMQPTATRQGETVDFDPRTRPWYQGAINSEELYITAPYLFHTSAEIGYTLAKQLNHKNGVVGVDISIQKLIAVLQEQKHTPSAQLLLFHADGQILLGSDPGILEARRVKSKASHDLKLNIKDLHSPAMEMFHTVFKQKKNMETTHTFMVAGEKWLGMVQRLPQISNQTDVYIAMVCPYSEIMADALAARLRNIIILAVAIIMAIIIGLIFSKRLSIALKDLSSQSATIRQFKLDTPISIRSSIKEVDELAQNMVVMQSAITRFVDIARALSAEKNIDRVVEMILDEAMHICRADGGGIGLVSDDETSLSYMLIKNKQCSTHLGGMSEQGLTTEAILLSKQDHSPESRVYHTKKSYTCSDSRNATLQATTIQSLHQSPDYHCQSLLVIPLLNRKDEMIGVLHLVNARSTTGEIQPFSPSRTTYVEALSSNAALALDNNRLLRAQKDLFDSFVQLIASAIDTKSPYTGGHCQRVPVLAAMLADAASSSKDSVFANFNLSAEEKYELHVASWLHDCGKVTTPEYVVDKATKLETIYNRIHEVRSRFEILWRDAEISYYKAAEKSPEKRESLQAELDTRQQQLTTDFEFIASCNLGGEFMAPELLERLTDIAGQAWQRHFDHRLGLSDDELARFDDTDTAPLPCTEQLLADKDFHIFKHIKVEQNSDLFCMEKPELLYNQGELYNLGIARGTLTPEERYKINDHVVQTINMLSSLPFPKEIRRVPSWAGNHHEKLDGTGYPRCLTGEALTFPERIMAIADIFEALSAADRPYKKPKKLSNCIKIMSFMRKDGHICPDLFGLFLTSGIYLQYAKEHMRPEQIDEVIIADYISEN